MGAGASIATASNEHHHDHHDERRRFDSSRVSARSTTRGSVRAMALQNHARQENSYISADKLTLNIPSQIATEPKQRKFREASSKAIDEKIVEQEPPQPLQSLSMFRSNFNLKLNLGNEEDDSCGQISDNEDDGDNSTSRGFDHRLIEIPEEVAPSPMGDLQVDNSGALSVTVDGLSVGVGASGITRPDRPVDRGRLPMRERLVILCKLGSGASSAVYKALDLQDMRLVALKTIQVYDKDKRIQMIRELSALFALIRENSRRESTMNRQKLSRRPEKYIVDFYDAFSNLEDGVVCLMIEYMDGGSLQDIADTGGCDDESTLANISIQALKGLSFLHGNLQLHRDLKPANFLISHRGEVKVADLGIMKQLTITKPGQLPRTNTFVGTASYMSPERIDGKEYSFPSDIWAFGLSLVTLALGRLPIDTQGGYWTILHHIRDSAPPMLTDAFSSDFHDFIGLCLKKKPEERATCAELLKHRFLNKAVPDDLTYGESQKRGKHELSTTLMAVQAHLTALQGDYRLHHNENKLGHSRLFGNLDLLDTPIPVLLRRLLLAEDDSATASQMRRRKPRLATLARQLHLPMDVVGNEIKEFLSGL